MSKTLFVVYFRDPNKFVKGRRKWYFLAAFLWKSDAFNYALEKFDIKSQHVKVMHGRHNVKVYSDGQ